MNLAAKPINLHEVQRLRKAVLAIAMTVLFGLSIPLSGGVAPLAHEVLEAIGIAMIGVCVGGRAWCSLYIGGRKKAEIVDRGPYSVVRNPLYLFSLIGAFGIGAQTGSIIFSCLFALLAWAVLFPTVRQEEIWLETAFGDAYRTYRERTPRFWPQLSLWSDEDVLEIKPNFFLLTLRDGLAFFLPVAVFEAIEQAQELNWLETLFQLP